MRQGGIKMAFVSICKEEALREGQMGLFRILRKSVLLVWPVGGEVRAYRGRCPHQDVPLESASFDGLKVTCGFHHWCFDARSGEGVEPRGCQLKPYAVRLEQGELQVELG
jgi:toluene monooxygenase system ferredoxin subunit